jgi:hypothetical protein
VLEFLAREIRKEKEIKWIPKKNEWSQVIPVFKCCDPKDPKDLKRS